MGPPDYTRTNPLLRWQRRTVLGAALSLLATGLAWLPVHHYWGAGAGELPHPVEPWLVRLHGLSALVGLFALGVVAASHVSRGWHLRQRRASGLAVCVLAGLAVATGYALSYLVSEAWRPPVEWTHVALGACMTGLGALHRRRAMGDPRQGPASASSAQGAPGPAPASPRTGAREGARDAEGTGPPEGRLASRPGGAAHGGPAPVSARPSLRRSPARSRGRAQWWSRPPR